MEATASSALLRRVSFAPRWAAGDGGMLTPARNRPAMVRMENKFKDRRHLRYYAAAATPARCGPKKEEKRRMKLVKGLERDLSAFYSMGFDAGQDHGQQISEAAEVLLAQLTKLRAEAKEMKQRRKQEKAGMKAAKTRDRAAAESSSSSESSDSECETVVKMSSRSSSSSSSRRTVSAAVSGPVTAAALQTEDVIEEAKSNLALNLEPQRCSSSGAEVALKLPAEGKIEVCIGGKCKKAGAMELMAEFEKEVGVEGAVVGCKCMGKCRDGPNVRVVNQIATAAAEDALMMKIVKGPLCIGVGLDDVGPIVSKFLGEGKGVAGFIDSLISLVG